MLTGWGRLPAPGAELLTENLERSTQGAVLSRGLGRSYGDSSLPANASDKIVGTAWPTASSRSTRTAESSSVRLALSLAEIVRLLAAARLVHAGYAGNEVRHARWHGLERRTRQEPSPRRLLRRSREEPEDAPR